MKRWLTALVILSGFTTSADGLSWNYADGFLLETKAAEGGGLNGSLSFAERWLFQATYLRLMPDEVSGNTTEATFGIGYRLPLAQTTDVVFGGGYSFVKANFEPLNDEAHGGYLSAAIRSRFIDRIEVEAFVTGTASEDTRIVDHDVEYGISGRYYFTPLVALSLGVSDSDQANDPVFAFGIRLQGSGFGS